MAGKSIRMLDEVAGIYDDSLIPVDQDGKLMSATGKQFREFAETAAEQYVEDATEVAEKAEQALAALGNDAQIAKKAADDAAESEARAKFYADQTESAAGGGVSSFNSRGGHVMPQSGDYTAEMVGAAPAGFGLGAATPFVAPTLNGYAYNADGVLHSCFFTAKYNTPNNQWAFGICISRTETVKTQIMWPEQGSVDAVNEGCFVVRRMKAGTWGEWEWGNPPMFLSVEYRTTERFHGKPVYVKRLDLGSIAAGDMTVPLNITNLSTVVRYQGYRNVTPLPEVYGASLTGQWTNYINYVRGGDVSVHVSSGDSGDHFYITIYYTKTTD